MMILIRLFFLIRCIIYNNVKIILQYFIMYKIIAKNMIIWVPDTCLGEKYFVRKSEDEVMNEKAVEDKEPQKVNHK